MEKSRPRDSRRTLITSAWVTRSKSWKDAVERELVTKNPFEKFSSTVGGNPDREFFIDRPTCKRVLDACPDSKWRLIFALCRFGGLRSPSDFLRLTWDDVLWDVEKIVVRSPKTEHHKGKGIRIIPLFPISGPTWTRSTIRRLTAQRT